MARRQWADIPAATSPLAASLLNDLEARKPEVESMPINLLDYGAQVNNTSAGAKTANVTALTNAINDANTSKRLIVAPPAEMWFTAGATFPVLDPAPGIIGTPKHTLWWFDKDGDCIVTKGEFKVLKGIYAVNQATTITATSAVFRIKNCAYGDFANLYAACGQANNTSVMLEQVYDGSLADGTFIAHLGCWYNVFRNVNAGYLSAGTQQGHGFSFMVHSSAVSVVNPTGQTPGTYTGSVAHNNVRGFNIEGKTRGVNLERATSNRFYGGQFIGNDIDVYGRVTSSGNTFVGTYHNQMITRPVDLDSSCTSNVFVSPTRQPQGTLGTLGNQPVVLASGESITEQGLTIGPLRIAAVSDNTVRFDGPGTLMDILKPDGTAAAIRLKDSNVHEIFGQWDFWNAAGSNSFITVDGTNAYIDLKEAGVPGTAGADRCRLFVNDNGAGKTRIEAMFNTGGAQPIAAQGGESLTVASATALTLPASSGRVYTISGTTTITSVVATDHTGKIVTLIFSGILTFTNGSNLKLTANFVTTANDTITLACDGTNWFEVSRQVLA